MLNTTTALCSAVPPVPRARGAPTSWPAASTCDDRVAIHVDGSPDPAATGVRQALRMARCGEVLVVHRSCALSCPPPRLRYAQAVGIAAASKFVYSSKVSAGGRPVPCGLRGDMKLCSAPAKAMAQWRPIVCFSNRTEEILHRSGRPSRILRPAVDAVGRDMGAAGPGVGDGTRNTPKEGVERRCERAGSVSCDGLEDASPPRSPATKIS